MNYRQIILNSKNKEDKQAYFITEYEKIEQSRNAPNFFPSCIKVIEDFKIEIKNGFENDLQNLLKYIEKAKNNELRFSGGAGENVGSDEWTKNENKAQYVSANKFLSNLDAEIYIPKNTWLNLSIKALSIIEEQLFGAIEIVNSSKVLVKSKQNNPKQPKKVFNSLADAAVDDYHLNEMHRILIEKKIINADNTITKSQLVTATLLYSFIKRFKQLGYFKKITDIALSPLVNKAFKMTEVHQTFKQAPVYDKEF